MRAPRVFSDGRFASVAVVGDTASFMLPAGSHGTAARRSAAEAAAYGIAEQNAMAGWVTLTGAGGPVSVAAWQGARAGEGLVVAVGSGDARVSGDARPRMQMPAFVGVENMLGRSSDVMVVCGGDPPEIEAALLAGTPVVYAVPSEGLADPYEKDLRARGVLVAGSIEEANAKVSELIGRKGNGARVPLTARSDSQGTFTTVGVMGRGRNPSRKEVEAASVLGELIAAHGWVLYTGGRAGSQDAPGVADMASEGARSRDGLVMAIASGGDRYEGVTEHAQLVIPTAMGDARNDINGRFGPIVAVCGESLGEGTRWEVKAALNTGNMAVVLGAPPGIQQYLESVNGQHLHAGLLRFASSPNQAIDLVEACFASRRSPATPPHVGTAAGSPRSWPGNGEPGTRAPGQGRTRR